MTGPSGAVNSWIDVSGFDELGRRRKLVVQHGDGEILLLVHEGVVHAFANRCIHRQRELAKGVVLNGRLVCPGHQWSFELGTGWEAIKGECQPTYLVKIEDGRLLVDAASRARRGGPA